MPASSTTSSKPIPTFRSRSAAASATRRQWRRTSRPASGSSSSERKAIAAPHFVADLCVEFPAHVIVGLDAKDGRLAVDGWSKLSNHDLFDLARQFERDGVEAFVFTDIGRDGMMSGVNVEATAELARELSVPVIASGGDPGPR